MHKVSTQVKAQMKAIQAKIEEMSSAKAKIYMVMIDMEEKFQKNVSAYEALMRSRNTIEALAKKDEKFKPMLDKINTQAEVQKKRLVDFKKTAEEVKAKAEYAEAQIEAMNALKDAQGVCGLDLFNENICDPKKFVAEIDKLVSDAEIDLNTSCDITSLGLDVQNS